MHAKLLSCSWGCMTQLVSNHLGECKWPLFLSPGFCSGFFLPNPTPCSHMPFSASRLPSPPCPFKSPSSSTNKWLVRPSMFLPWQKANSRRPIELVTCFLGRSQMLIFCSCGKKACPSDWVGAEGEGKVSCGSNLHKSPSGVFVFPFATFVSWAVLPVCVAKAIFSTLA